jgi:hypothetical protein
MITYARAQKQVRVELRAWKVAFAMQARNGAGPDREDLGVRTEVLWRRARRISRLLD